ncbi:MAG: SOS response-associated peptidase family protein [Ruminococcus sp.]|nr:SOS response-associated peptidase family protein [Ruminococcus sp.]
MKKTRFAIQSTGAEIAFLAGLYRYAKRDRKQISVFSVITREAVETVGSIHDRMPLMLKKEDIFDWIRPNSSLSGIAERAVTNVIMEEAAV